MNALLEQAAREIARRGGRALLVGGCVRDGLMGITSTDIDCDGMLEGPSLQLYAEILAQISGIRLIASGGVSSMADVYALHETGVPAVIVGKALYEGRITPAELEQHNVNLFEF